MQIGASLPLLASGPRQLSRCAKRPSLSAIWLFTACCSPWLAPLAAEPGDTISDPVDVVPLAHLWDGLQPPPQVMPSLIRACTLYAGDASTTQTLRPRRACTAVASLADSSWEQRRTASPIRVLVAAEDQCLSDRRRHDGPSTNERDLHGGIFDKDDHCATSRLWRYRGIPSRERQRSPQSLGAMPDRRFR